MQSSNRYIKFLDTGNSQCLFYDGAFVYDFWENPDMTLFYLYMCNVYPSI